MEKINTFIKEQWPILLIAVFGLFLKILFLDSRPLHHDESLHAQYGKYFADSFTHGYYKYDPLLHGPLLYHLQGLWTWIAGPLGKSGIRFISVLLGFLLSLSPLLFRKHVSKISLLFVTTFLAISPSFTYWSRFLRHDFLVLASLVFAAWAWILKPKYWSLYLGIAAGLHFSTKENFFVHLALLSGFLITRFLVTRKFEIPQRKTVLLFIIGFFLVSIPLYTAYFQYPAGFIDAIYRKSIGYWLDQHHTERIKGPFYFNTLILSVYESWLIPTLAILSFLWLRNQKRKWLFVDIGSMLLFIALSVVLSFPLPSFLSTWFKVKNNLDLFIFLSSIYISLRVTVTLIARKHISLAFWGYLSFSSFFTYSFLGEKVPWLAIYPTIALVIFTAKCMDFLSPKLQTVFFATLVLCLPKTIYVNHIVPGSAKELISQVHTTHEYENLLLNLQAALNSPTGHIKPRILVLEDNGWPLSWFIWGYAGVDYGSKRTSLSNYDFVFDKLINAKLAGELHKSHNRTVVPLRHYWWPSFSDITLSRWLNLVFRHKPWSATGEYKVAVWIKRDGFFSE